MNCIFGNREWAITFLHSWQQTSCGWVNITCMDLDNVMKTSWPCFSIQCLPPRAVFICTQHIHRSLLRGKIIRNCLVVFTITNFRFDLIFFKKKFVVIYLSFHAVFCQQSSLLPKAVFPFLLALTTHKWTCISWLQLWLCLLSIFETGIITVKSNTIWSVTDTSCVAELVLWAWLKCRCFFF